MMIMMIENNLFQKKTILGGVGLVYESHRRPLTTRLTDGTKLMLTIKHANFPMGDEQCGANDGESC